MNRNSFAAVGQSVGALVVIFGGLASLFFLVVGVVWVLFGGTGAAWVCVCLAVAGLVACVFLAKAGRRSSDGQADRVLTEVNKRYETEFSTKYLVHSPSTLVAFDSKKRKILIATAYDHERAEVRDFSYVRNVTTDEYRVVIRRGSPISRLDDVRDSLAVIGRFASIRNADLVQKIHVCPQTA